MTVSAALVCRDLSVAYGDHAVLADVDLEVDRGELLAVLGPSGSGKTTLLYAIAGFVVPTTGEIEVGGRLVGSAHHHLPPEERRVAVVFQHYALWPHLTAAETVAYPLRRSGSSRADADRSARELLARMGIGELGDRRPAELSGGQQQRVGLARALARGADVHLFDEPTAHLDTMLRDRLAAEMSDRRRELDAAGVYATHDAGEALALADRVALLRAGRLVQVGTPVEVYEQPVDAWAAHLTGPASVLDGGLVREGDQTLLRLGGQVVDVAIDPPTATGDVAVVVRPTWARLGGDLPGTVSRVWFRGSHTDHGITAPGGEVVVRADGRPRARVGEAVTWGLDRVWLTAPPR